MRGELEALSAEIADFPAICRVLQKVENAAMKFSAIPEASVTVRAAKDKMKGKSEGKGEPSVSFSGQGQRKVAQTKLGQTFAVNMS